MSNKHERQAAAGRWLREARERHGFATAAALATRLGVSTSLVSRLETGDSAATDERAEQIADALDLDLVEVRRGLGLWAPEETGERGPTTAIIRGERVEITDTGLLARVQELVRRGKLRQLDYALKAIEEDDQRDTG
ncbi:MAG: helix-turn-helix transcriptional regulator [Streptosporangiaceae bacterium]